MTLREATRSDVPAIVATGQRFIQASSYARALQDNPEQFMAFVAWLIEDPQGQVWVLEHRGSVCGILGATSFVHPMDGLPAAAEMFWWVDPETRGHGLKLLRAFEAWARARGARKVIVAAPTPDVERLYERLHYTRVETSYERMIAC
jgi:RimJ/RimL family protein N-acetyltransferase